MNPLGPPPPASNRGAANTLARAKGKVPVARPTNFGRERRKVQLIEATPGNVDARGWRTLIEIPVTE